MTVFAGINVSLVGLGCNNFGMRCDAAQSKAVVDAALDAGVTLFDTADVYGGTQSEVFLGQALGSRRAEAIVATKFGARHADGRGGGRPEYVRQACDASLARLGIDRIDLYQLHMPDADVPVAETLGALAALVKDGKVGAIGCSNFTSAMLTDAADAAGDGSAFVTVQNEFSLLQRRAERNLLGTCERLGVGFLPYFPLASGLLTGKYQRGEPPPPGTRLALWGADRTAGMMSDDNFDKVDALRGLAAEQGHDLLELAMSWLASRPAITSIIAGATSPQQVRANVDAVGWKLSEQDLKAIDGIVPPPT